MNEPPFFVPERKIKKLLGSSFELKLLQEQSKFKAFKNFIGGDYPPILWERYTSWRPNDQFKEEQARLNFSSGVSFF